MKFAHLHGHTTYSFLDGYGTPNQIASRMQELGHKSAIITDHGNIYGHVPFNKVMLKNDIKPIFGCEMYVVDDLTIREKFNPSLGVEGFPHVTIIAKTQQGYANLLKLVSIASCEGFYYKPRIDWQTIAKYQEGLIVLSGCIGGYPSRLCLNKDKGLELAWYFCSEKREWIENFYIELVPEPGMTDRNTHEDISHTIVTLNMIAKDLKIPTVMTADAHFPKPEDHICEDIMVCIAMGKKLDDKSRYIRLPEYQYYCTAEEILERADKCASYGYYTDVDEMSGDEHLLQQDFIKAIERTQDIVDSIEVEIPQAKPVTFYGRREDEDAKDVLRKWVEQGFIKRKEQGLIPEDQYDIYRARVEREFEVIAGKGFADYILTITDIARWAKSQNTLVMCRGSAGGCLLLWLLECSETDSVRHDLSFERFYNDTRNDPPDVDMDFETWFRPKVIEYIYSKYGRDKCSQVAVLTLLRPKNAIQDVANVYGIPSTEYTALTAELDSKDDDFDGQIEDLTDEKALAVLAKYPQLRIASRLLGQCRQQGINAAGFIISSEPLNKAIALISNNSNVQFSSVDKDGAADIGLLKLDLLGVAAYDVIGHAVRRLGMKFEDLYTMPLGDERDIENHKKYYEQSGIVPDIPWRKAYDLVRTRTVAGIFQIDGSAMRVAEKAGLDQFEELYAASALCRPGAMDHVPEYANNKYNVEAFNTYLSKMHPIAQEIVRPTYGILLYQEQVMSICRLMGNMPWPQIHKLRKRIATASSIGFALGPEYSDDFFRGCEETGVSKQEAEFWWSAIKAHGIYSFNKSHCTTYGIVGYFMLWLKANYPEAYYESYLRVEGSNTSPNDILMKRLVREYISSGGTIKVIDPQHSQESFYSPYKGLIVGGWGNLHGIGAKTAQQIIKLGPYYSWDKLKAVINPSIYYRLYETGMIGTRDNNIQRLISLASWIPVDYTDEKACVIRDRYSLSSPGAIAEKIKGIDGDVVVGGYLTAKRKRGRTGQFRGEQIECILEDETGFIIMRVSRKLSTTIGQKLKLCKEGDYMAVRGWWTGEQLFIKKFAVLLPIDK